MPNSEAFQTSNTLEAPPQPPVAFEPVEARGEGEGLMLAGASWTVEMLAWTICSSYALSDVYLAEIFLPPCILSPLR